MVHLFIDTNIFLHFKYFEEIPWRSFVNGREFKVTIAPIVLDELDKHKRSPKQKIASRAKAVLSKIEAAVTNPDSSILEIVHKRPSEKTLDSYQLDRKEQDDLLLATIIEFKATNADCRLVTYDTGPALRARSVDVEIIKLDDTFLLPTEKTEEEQEIAKLKKELAALKNTYPKLSLSFHNNSEFIEIELEPHIGTRQEFFGDRLNKEKQRLPKLEYLDPVVQAQELDKKIQKATSNTEKILLMSASIPNGFSHVSKEQVDWYNRELNQYFIDYSTFLSESYEYELYRSMSFPLNITLVNSGTAPAEDIDIRMHFPDGFSLLSEDELLTEPELPYEPHKPKNRFDMVNLSPMLPLPNFFPGSSGRSFDIPDFNKPDIRKTNSYEVTLHQRSLKHHQSYKIQPLYVVFEKIEKINGFSIDYVINVANLPQPITGKLNVKVSKRTTNNQC